MIYQEPAEGIMKIYETTDSISYSIPCECHNPDDDISFEIEVDEGQLTVNTYVKTKTPYWQTLVDECKSPMFESSWLNSLDWSIRSTINGLYHRMMVTYEVWTKGYVSFYSTTIMNKQTSYNYAHTILNSIEKMEKK